jgi:hypothetical protein
MNTIRTVVLAGAAVVSLAVPAASQAAPSVPRTDPPSSAPDRYTALAVSVLAPPHPVAAADGHVHLAYELLLINPLPYTATVERIEVLDGERPGRVVTDVRGDALTAALSSMTQVPGRVIAGGSVHRAILDVVLPPGARPRSLVHRLTVTTDPADPALPAQFLGGRTAVAADRPIVVGPMVTGAGWVSLTGCCTPEAHRLVMQTLNGGIYLAQRFAVDMTKLTPDGRLVTGPPDQVTSYPAYGTPVLSAAPGIVVAAVDRFLDNVPLQEPELTDPALIPGNHIVVDLGTGHFALYAHLKPGSVRVAVGDRVGSGRQIGQIGNTGRSSFPHTHFQIMDSPSPLASDGLPFVLRSFDSPGSVPPLDQIDLSRPIPIGPALAGHHERVSPMILQVIDYPAV